MKSERSETKIFDFSWQKLSITMSITMTVVELLLTTVQGQEKIMQSKILPIC